MKTETTTEIKHFFTEPGLAKLTEKIATLNKRAKKLGFPPITIKSEPGTMECAKWERDGQNVWAVYEFETGTARKKHAKVTVNGFYVEVTGESPKLNGWKFAATLQHLEGGNIVRNISGAELPAKYRTARSECDHCKKFRHRNDTYVVVHEDGRTMQVGKQCLKDFTGHKSPEALVAWLETLANLIRDVSEVEESDREGSFGRGERTSSTTALLAFSVMYIRKNGYVSKKEAEYGEKIGTASAVFACLTSQKSWEAAKDSKRLVPITTADVARSEEVLLWVRSKFGDKNISEMSEYESNLYFALQGDTVNFRIAGLAVSAVFAHQRAMGEIEDRKRAQKAAPAKPFVGTVGERLRNLPLTCTHVHAIDGDYGTTTFCRFADAEGHMFMWKASGSPGVRHGGNWRGVEVGLEVLLTGTLDSQGPDKYNHGLATNFLKRCKLEPVVTTAPAGRGRL